MYAVMGVTGKVGGSVATTLLASGCRVRAIMRDAAKAHRWTQQGCEIAFANTEHAAALTSAFQDVEGVFVMLPPVFDPGAGFPEAKTAIAALTESLKRAAVPKIVCLSTIGADAQQPNLLNQLGLLEEALRSLPVPVAFLRAAWFVDNAALDVASARSRGLIESFLQPLDKVYRKRSSTGTSSAVTSRLVSLARPTIARSSEYCASVIPLARAAAECEAMQ